MDIFERLINREGGFVDNPVDRGGPTKYGITAKTLSAYRGCDVNHQDISGLSEDEAKAIYKKLYCDTPGYSKIKNELIKELVIDCAVLHGQSRTTTWLQRTLGVKEDGICGPQTHAALGHANDYLICQKLTSERVKFIADIVVNDPSQLVFLRGWIARAYAWSEGFA